MLLHRDELVEIEYATAQSLLLAKLQVKGKIGAEEFSKIFSSTINVAKEHPVQLLLVDFGMNEVSLSESEYKELMAKLAMGLRLSSICRIARVALEDTIRDQRVNSVYKQIQAAITLPLEFGNFTNRAEALRWLMESNKTLK